MQSPVRELVGLALVGLARLTGAGPCGLMQPAGKTQASVWSPEAENLAHVLMEVVALSDARPLSGSVRCFSVVDCGSECWCDQGSLVGSQSLKAGGKRSFICCVSVYVGIIMMLTACTSVLCVPLDAGGIGIILACHLFQWMTVL